VRQTPCREVRRKFAAARLSANRAPRARRQLQREGPTNFSPRLERRRRDSINLRRIGRSVMIGTRHDRISLDESRLQRYLCLPCDTLGRLPQASNEVAPLALAKSWWRACHRCRRKVRFARAATSSGEHTPPHPAAAAAGTPISHQQSTISRRYSYLEAASLRYWMYALRAAR
jgi:hypothetical protein